VRKFRARFAKPHVARRRRVVQGNRHARARRWRKKLVDCDIWTETQSGEKKILGAATLAL
jgi:hypothetical protein